MAGIIVFMAMTLSCSKEKDPLSHGDLSQNDLPKSAKAGTSLLTEPELLGKNIYFDKSPNRVAWPVLIAILQR